jgi:hypothetical protein
LKLLQPQIHDLSKGYMAPRARAERGRERNKEERKL